MPEHWNIGMVEEWEKRDSEILELRNYGIIGLRD
jgi:hypothetical protein